MNYEKINKKIAVFMGGAYKEVVIFGKKEQRFYFPGDNGPDYIKNFEQQTPFHKDYNLLMSVIDKIESVRFADVMWDDKSRPLFWEVEIKRNRCIITGPEIIAQEAETKIKAIYKAVDVFIHEIIELPLCATCLGNGALSNDACTYTCPECNGTGEKPTI